MKIFNSLGSNYKLDFAMKALFSVGSESSRINLLKNLEENFGGKAFLFYKGRSAIEEGLRILNLKSDDLVAINGFTCYAVYKAIENANLKTHLVDTEKDDLNFSPKALENAIKNNPRIKVVIVQNTLGFPCDIESIIRICNDNGLILIEDLAHSVGSQYKNGKAAGSVGDLVILSFSQDKIIDGISGGALIIRNATYNYVSKKLESPKFSQQLKDRFYPFLTLLIRNSYGFLFGKLIHHALRKIDFLSLPMESSKVSKTISDWYCNLILTQIKAQQKNLEHRRKIARIYDDLLTEKVKIKSVTEAINFSTNLRFPILVDGRSNIIKLLKSKGIYISDIWYDSPIAPKRFMSKIDYKNDCPISEEISEKILNLPTHINITEEEASDISKFLNSCLK